MNLVVFDIEQVSIDSDKSEGSIRNPSVFYFPIQRGFSGSIQTLPLCMMVSTRGPLVYSRLISSVVKNGLYFL